MSDALALQPGIFRRPPHTYSLQFRLRNGVGRVELAERLNAFLRSDVSNWAVVGIGSPLVRALGGAVPGLREFSPLQAGGRTYPSTQAALWLLLQGEVRQEVDPGVLLLLARKVVALLRKIMDLADEQPAYTHRESRDLAGYRDGTENPKAIEDAVRIASGPGQGGAFALEQRWVHDLSVLEAMPQEQVERLIGRRIPPTAHEPDEELAHPSPSAHISRTKQEDAGFMFRRSQAFGTRARNGLQFIAYCSSLAVFDSHLRRMIGLDGPADDIARFSRPDTGGYYFCPAVRGRAGLDASWLQCMDLS